MSNTPLKKRGRPAGSKSRAQAPQADAKPSRKGALTIADIIRSGLLASKATAEIVADVREAFPGAKTSAATVHNYRSAMRKEGIEVKTIRKSSKTKKARKLSRQKKRSITEAIQEALLAGKTNEETVEYIKNEFPSARTSANSVVIQRSNLRKAGKSIPSSWEAKKIAKQSQKPLISAGPAQGKPGKAETTIAIASDHAGVELKAVLKKILNDQGIHVLDLGTHNGDSVDYPDYATALAQAMAWGHASRGIAICGSGIGISIAINRHRHVRAALCTNGLMARLARQHNDVNVLVLGARLTGLDVAKDCLEQFLNTQFEGQRHSRRVEKMS